MCICMEAKIGVNILMKSIHCTALLFNCGEKMSLAENEGHINGIYKAFLSLFLLNII